MGIVFGVVEFAFVAVGVEDAFPVVLDQDALIPFVVAWAFFDDAVAGDGGIRVNPGRPTADAFGFDWCFNAGVLAKGWE